MDPNQSKRGSHSSKGRGRGSRSQPVQSQPTRPSPQPYFPQPPPQPFYPPPHPVNPSSQQRQYFHQPPPMNPNLYNIAMTSEFTPFIDFRDGPPRHEASVERELPLYDNEDDDIDFVPETQFPKAIGTIFFNNRYYYYFFIYNR